MKRKLKSTTKKRLTKRSRKGVSRREERSTYLKRSTRKMKG